MKEENSPKTVTIDIKAPELLEILITDKATGKVFFNEIVKHKDFKTGSKGYYVSGKATNPDSGSKYQIGCNIILIGSKPK